MRGELLVADAYADWAVTERETFRRELVEAATLAATHATTLGEDEVAVRLAQRAIDADALARTPGASSWARCGAPDGPPRPCAPTSRSRTTSPPTSASIPPSRAQDLYLRILRSEGADHRRARTTRARRCGCWCTCSARPWPPSAARTGWVPDHALARAVADLVA